MGSFLFFFFPDIRPVIYRKAMTVYALCKAMKPRPAEWYVGKRRFEPVKKFPKLTFKKRLFLVAGPALTQCAVTSKHRALVRSISKQNEQDRDCFISKELPLCLTQTHTHIHKHTQVQIAGIGIKVSFNLRGRLQHRLAPWLYISGSCVCRGVPADARMLL